MWVEHKRQQETSHRYLAPMVCTHRLQYLQGLDGEATERMVEHLAEPAAEQQEPEEEYAVARVLADQGPSGLALPSHKAHVA